MRSWTPLPFLFQLSQLEDQNYKISRITSVLQVKQLLSFTRQLNTGGNLQIILCGHDQGKHLNKIKHSMNILMIPLQGESTECS